MTKNKETIKIEGGIELSRIDHFRKELLESITRSYDDTYPTSYLVLDIARVIAKYRP